MRSAKRKQRRRRMENGQVQMPDTSQFLNNIGPGGKYYRYSQVVVFILALTFLTLLVMILLPYLNGGKYQNSVSKIFGVLPIKNEQLKTSKTPVPRIIYPLPTGKQGWNFSHSQIQGPDIQTAYVDPLTPGSSEQQTVSLSIQSNTPVTKVTASLFTDTQTLTQDMKLTSGIPTNGTWIVSWKVNDSYNNIYHIDFVAVSSAGTSREALTFRYP